MAAVTSAGRASGLEPLGLALDTRAEEGLYQRNAARVFAFCLSRLGRREDAEDAVQTTFLHAVRSVRRGVVPLVESAWLLGIARNVCLERWEAAGKRSRVEAVCDPVELERTSAAVPGRRDELIGLEEALARMPEQQRRAVLLRDWRGLSYDEVATQLGVSHAAAETLIFRGRKTLAAQLHEGVQATRRRLASLANLGSLFTGAKTAFTGAAAATKIAAAVTIVAVSGAGIAVGGTALRGDGSEPPRRGADLQGPRAAVTPPSAPAPTLSSPAIAPAAAEPASSVPRKPGPRAVPAPAARVSGSEPLSPAGAGAGAAAPDAIPPAPAAAATAKTPSVEKVVGAVQPSVPPTVKTPVEKVVEAVVPPAVQEPVESVVDAVTPAVPPVVPQAVETLVESLPELPVEPPPVVEELPVDLPPVPPLLP